jgi:hypothetical protein
VEEHIMQYVELALEKDKKPRQLRFTVTALTSLEEQAGCGIRELLSRKQDVYATVLLLRYGLEWADRSMTQKRAAQLLQTFLDEGGDITTLWEGILKALNQSGAYGRIGDVVEEPRPNAAAVGEDDRLALAPTTD